MFLSRIFRKTVSLVPRNVRCKAQGSTTDTAPTSVQASSRVPGYLEERLDLFDRLKAEQDARVAGKVSERIAVTLLDGRVLEGQSWRSTPYELASQVSNGLADSSVVAKVNGELWDLDRPLENDATLELLKFDDDQGKQVFWHSSAHLLGRAMEQRFGGLLGTGPPLENGFYYDMYMQDCTIKMEDLPVLETLCKEFMKKKEPFVRLVVGRADLLQLFRHNKFKREIIEERISTATATVYRCGPLIDLCLGPHIRHAGKVKALSIISTSNSNWNGDINADALQRVRAISFPNKNLLAEWKHFQEEAAKRDHRKIGLDQELFFFHHLSPGSCFFLPNGAHIYNTLLDFLREEYRRRGYQEVITPNIYNKQLYETSGHWQHYAENIFSFKLKNEETYGLKPMNCPGHCLMFAHQDPSFRDLPLRFADFGVLHRNESTSTLSGLTRVRRFQQDDAHIFCSLEQIEEEIKGCLEFLEHVYGIFGFQFDLFLSTRPEAYLGDAEKWDIAEDQLKKSLNDFCGDRWKLNPGDGAFYGPKIDIVLRDALQRKHQSATIQLDFQLPEQFELLYQTTMAGIRQRPVMIHRAILGSVERMMAILVESFAGKWPFWLSPRQVKVIPVMPVFNEYARKVSQHCHDAGFRAEVVDGTDSLNRKVRNAQVEQYNFILVVGQKEVDNASVNVRTRCNKVLGEFPLDDFVKRCNELKQSRSNNCLSVLPSV
ncbi:threonine--tRNA ligase 1, cytoplasmic-like [Sycon ciliatum]|uniref:threonine--tRNA ligase 1, cytoplasmic-like n=1 Tax=Sycon ciliatum TaxID=27933 RepID=UPI0020A93D9D|eukprot:scpid55461/ scgid9337/ Threonine--tRNA ligase, cytoplasmic; Threonyl-tRNA synthetase